MIKITNAKFITSVASASQFLKADKPIIAVCGKSNVGKSSFINMLANQKKLAKVSQQPGRTRLVNYFDFGQFILADLPGYGFAKVAKTEKEKWAKLLDSFFADKTNCCHVFTLCDIRHDPTADDRDMLNFLYFNAIPFSVIATKADKLSKVQISKSVANIAAIYKCGVQNIIATSAQTKQGVEAVTQRLQQIIDTYAGGNE